MRFDNCRLCGSAELRLGMKLSNSPRNISHLPSADEIESDRGIELSVYQCENCRLVQLRETLDEDYYDEYLMTVSHSPQMQAYQAGQAEEFVTEFHLEGKSVIEVGCGDGNYLAHLRRAGCKVSGIEPSATFRQEAKQRSLEVHGGYVDRDRPAPNGPYDAVVTRQVLEHVPDPNSFLTGLRLSLKPDGVGLIEVPSFEQALEFGRFYDFFADHLNYFSAATLRFALEKNGFDVVRASRGMNGEYLVAWVRNGQPEQLQRIQTAAESVVRDLQALITQRKKAGKRIAIWGSGAKGLTALGVAGIRDVAYVVDSDPHKIGRYTSVSHLKIVAPTHLRKESVDVVLITALAYKMEILHHLRDELHFEGEVIALGNPPEIL